MFRSKSAKFITGLIISGIFLYFAVRKINPAEFKESLRDIQFSFVIYSLFFGIAGYFIRAWRWDYFLIAVRRVGFFRLFSATMIGFMSNNVLPARVGEFLRAYVVSKKESISFSAVLGSLVSERTMDGLTISLIALFSLNFLPLQDDIKIGVTSFFLIFIIILIVIFLFINIKSLQGFLLSFLPGGISFKIKDYIDNFIVGLKAINRIKIFVITFVASFPIWYVSALYFYFMELAMDIHLPFGSSVAILVSVAIGVIIPSSPGFIGVYHFFCQKALEIYGIDPSTALAYATITHLVQYIVITATGIIFLFYENMSLGEINFSKSKGRE